MYIFIHSTIIFTILEAGVVFIWYSYSLKSQRILIIHGLFCDYSILNVILLILINQQVLHVVVFGDLRVMSCCELVSWFCRVSAGDVNGPVIRLCWWVIKPRIQTWSVKVLYVHLLVVRKRLYLKYTKVDYSKLESISVTNRCYTIYYTSTTWTLEFLQLALTKICNHWHVDGLYIVYLALV